MTTTTLLSAYMTAAVRHVFADQCFTGRLVGWTHDTVRSTREIARKPTDERGFAVHPPREGVEHILVWLTIGRRELLPETISAVAGFVSDLKPAKPWHRLQHGP
ncbi:hypothetical protein ABTX15_31385 [Micromonospora sp. NPDC094482]|uniref:hypothetical protein n=1 Tax=unclassified Micromonospora TaxID=2617518 RepID=UPI003319142E